MMVWRETRMVEQPKVGFSLCLAPFLLFLYCVLIQGETEVAAVFVVLLVYLVSMMARDKDG